MTKEQFLKKWVVISAVKDKMLPDLEAVIATEIEKAKVQPQPVELKGNCSTFDGSRLVDQDYKPTEQPKPFDKDRFEAMFRAVVANGGHELDHKQAIELTEEALAQLDAYYATKEGGSNG